MNEEQVKIFQKVVKYGAIALAVLLIVSIFSAILTGVLAIFGISGAVGEIKDFSAHGEIQNIEIEIAAAELKITEGAEFSVKSNLKKLNVDVNNKTLNIREKNIFGFVNYNGAVLEITVPKDFKFINADIETGAGVVDIEKLSAENLNLELGAGTVTIESITATKTADIDGGAGKLVINGGSFYNLDFDMGVGETKIMTEITGGADIDMGVGKAELILVGEESSYKIDFSKGLGSMSYNGDDVENNQIIGNGSVRIDIDGGVGSLIVKTVGLLNQPTE